VEWSSVKRLRICGSEDEIHIGDRIQFWRAVPDGGMVGVGDIVNEPPHRLLLESELQFSHNATARLSVMRSLAAIVSKEKKEKFVPPSHEARAGSGGTRSFSGENHRRNTIAECLTVAATTRYL